jgi:hypothetical protein
MMKKEHLSTDKRPKSKEEKLDNQLCDSFPTSDPPSFSPGAVGAPKHRATGARQKAVATAPKAPRET